MEQRRNIGRREVVRSASFLAQERLKEAVERKREERVARGR